MNHFATVVAAIAAAARDYRLLIVPGGDAFADAVRDTDRRLRLEARLLTGWRCWRWIGSRIDRIGWQAACDRPGDDMRRIRRRSRSVWRRIAGFAKPIHPTRGK